MKVKTFFSAVLAGCIVLLAAGAFGAGQETPGSPSFHLPQLHYVFEPVVDGTEITHDFILQNKGPAPLMIHKVTTDWGCTAVSYPRQIPPGGEGKIKIKVSTNGHGGKRLYKTITVKTNDQREPSIKLTVSGYVEKFASIIPSRVRLMGIAGQPIKAAVKILPDKKYPFKITDTEAINRNNIHYTLEELQNPQGTGYLLSIENSRKTKGRYYDVISLKTDSKIKPLIKISVYGIIMEPKQGGKK